MYCAGQLCTNCVHVFVHITCAVVQLVMEASDKLQSGLCHSVDDSQGPLIANQQADTNNDSYQVQKFASMSSPLTTFMTPYLTPAVGLAELQAMTSPACPTDWTDRQGVTELGSVPFACARQWRCKGARVQGWRANGPSCRLGDAVSLSHRPGREESGPRLMTG